MSSRGDAEVNGDTGGCGGDDRTGQTRTGSVSDRDSIRGGADGDGRGRSPVGVLAGNSEAHGRNGCRSRQMVNVWIDLRNDRRSGGYSKSVGQSQRGAVGGDGNIAITYRGVRCDGDIGGQLREGDAGDEVDGDSRTQVDGREAGLEGCELASDDHAERGARLPAAGSRGKEGRNAGQHG